MSEVPWIQASTIGAEEARATWALAARMRLEEVAREYHAVISTSELGTWVQERSRVRTGQAARHWMPDVLYRTMQDNAERAEPFLASLVIEAQGHIGANYAGLVEHLRGITVTNPDAHAAQERLDCYRHFGADLPAGGGEPGPLPTAAPQPRRTPSASGSTRPRAVREPAAPKKVEKVAAICPTCFMALPASGVCDTCD